MPNAKDVVVESSPASPPQSPVQMTPPGLDDHSDKHKEPKKTPLPLHQLVPLAFVLLSESLCGTMITPFVGLLVARLQDWDPDQAGYASGMMVGMFALGQLCSSKTWGWISDEYGRRFPLVSGLFTTGLMILGFGLSGNIWFCALFRFGQGLFNGNMLVAKTVIADITDKTNEAQGFSFTSICSAVGFLIGPTLGGLLYDPHTQDWLQWANFSEDGIFGRRPALLPCLVIFAYTFVGMLACTFFVQESNPNAKPLPTILKTLYPCMWREAEAFVPARVPTDTDQSSDDEHNIPVHLDDGSAASAVRVSAAAAVGLSSDGDDLGSPVVKEDTRLFNSSFMEESLVLTTVTDVKIRHRHRHRRHERERRAEGEEAEEGEEGHRCGRRHAHSREGRCHRHRESDQARRSGSASAAPAEEHGNPLYDGATGRPAVGSSRGPAQSASTATFASGSSATSFAPTEVSSLTSSFSSVEGTRSAASRSDAHRSPAGSSMVPPDAAPPHRVDTSDLVPAPPTEGAAVPLPVEEEHFEKFGYKQAFTRPYTRKMLTQYMILVAADNTAQQLFPLWCITTVAAGGLGMTSAEVGRFLLFNSIPLFCSNFCFHKVVPHYSDKIGLFRIAVMMAGVAVAIMPFMYYLPAYWATYLFTFLCYSTRQFFCTWCYSLNTMLTARSAPPGFVGAIMGINQSCGAAMRAVMPFISAPVYAWSVGGRHPIPFNHVFGFVLAGIGYLVAGYRSYSVRTNADGRLELV